MTPSPKPVKKTAPRPIKAAKKTVVKRAAKKTAKKAAMTPAVPDQAPASLPILVQVTPVEAAQKLTEALTDYTSELHQVKRRYRGVGVVAGIALFGVVGTVFVRHEGKINQCHKDNDIRSGVLHIADLIGGSGTNPGTKAFVATLRHDFALEDCGAVSWP